MKERYETRINNFLKTIKEYEFIRFFMVHLMMNGT